MHDDPTLLELAALLRQPGALGALRDVVQAQLELSAAGRERLPMVTVSPSDPAMVMVIDCARRREEMSQTDAPASRCAWLAEPEIGGYRCRICRRAEVGTTRAHRLDDVRGARDGG